eukprot:3941042-Rhodomonas_salina.1
MAAHHRCVRCPVATFTGRASHPSTRAVIIGSEAASQYGKTSRARGRRVSCGHEADAGSKVVAQDLTHCSTGYTSRDNSAQASEQSIPSIAPDRSVRLPPAGLAPRVTDLYDG